MEIVEVDIPSYCDDSLFSETLPHDDAMSSMVAEVRKYEAMAYDTAIAGKGKWIALGYIGHLVETIKAELHARHRNTRLGFRKGDQL